MGLPGHSLLPSGVLFLPLFYQLTCYLFRNSYSLLVPVMGIIHYSFYGHTVTQLNSGPFVGPLSSLSPYIIHDYVYIIQLKTAT